MRIDLSNSFSPSRHLLCVLQLLHQDVMQLVKTLSSASVKRYDSHTLQSPEEVHAPLSLLGHLCGVKPRFEHSSLQSRTPP